MSERDERPKSPDSGDEDAAEPVLADEYRMGTAPIGEDDQRFVQTQTPASDDDDGVPDDVEGEGDA
jgi:hypothetical protein